MSRQDCLQSSERWVEAMRLTGRGPAQIVVPANLRWIDVKCLVGMRGVSARRPCPQGVREQLMALTDREGSSGTLALHGEPQSGARVEGRQRAGSPSSGPLNALAAWSGGSGGYWCGGGGETGRTSTHLFTNDGRRP
jgi:hypothetical protein